MNSFQGRGEDFFSYNYFLIHQIFFISTRRIGFLLLDKWIFISHFCLLSISSALFVHLPLPSPLLIFAASYCNMLSVQQWIPFDSLHPSNVGSSTDYPQGCDLNVWIDTIISNRMDCTASPMSWNYKFILIFVLHNLLFKI